MNKTWLITGTSTGIGRELVERLLERGDTVAATLRKPGALDDLKKVHGDRLWIGIADVADVSTLRKVVNDAFAQLGRIDVVISNAGYGLFGGAEEVSDEQIQRQLDTNVMGSIQLARAVLPHLREQGGGHLIQVSSTMGQRTMPFASLYCMSKWAIEGFCDALSQEVSTLNIKVTIIEPGATRTDFGSRSGDFAPAMNAYKDTPVGRAREMITNSSGLAKGDPRKVAQAIIDCAGQPEPPLRLTLGSDAYGVVRAALVQRLATLDAHKDIAFSTDFDA
ncbi:SDR family oxidoreductase [Pseudomonas bharatica]|uniref:SDR family oxidoreductase n=1 Tax=Pseudomonas bharatica TaxID=2692112 RepID=UPI003B288D0B